MPQAEVKWRGCIVTDEHQVGESLTCFGAPEIDYRIISTGDFSPDNPIAAAAAVLLIAVNAQPAYDWYVIRNMFPRVVTVLLVRPDWPSDENPPFSDGPDTFFPYPFEPQIMKWGWPLVRRLLVQKTEFAELKGMLKKARSVITAHKQWNASAEKASLKEREMLQHSLKQIALMTEERQRLETDLSAARDEMEKEAARLVDVLPDLLESRWPTHRGHSRKTMEIAGTIADRLGLPETDTRVILNAARLHDIGLLAVPDELLNGDPPEGSSLQYLDKSLERAARFLEGFARFREEARLIRYMGEFVDGSGKPKGLRTRRIPLGSRILAVSEYYDEMVYRRSMMTGQEALGEIELLTGTRFDPRVVHALYYYVNRHSVRHEDRTRELKLFELKPGMQLATGIFAQSGAKLVAGETILTDETIQQLTKYNRDEPLEDFVFVRL